MLEKPTVTNIVQIPCTATSQYEHIITLDVKGQAFTVHYTDVGNNAEYDEEIFITCNGNLLDDDCSSILSALWDWADDNMDSIIDLKAGDTLEINIEEPIKNAPNPELKKAPQSLELMLKNNIEKIKVRPPSPKPQRRPKFN